MRIQLASDLDMLRSYVEDEFGELGQCAASIEHALENEVKSVKKDLAHEASKILDQHQFDLCESIMCHAAQLRDTFPNIVRYSLFVRAYSLLEFTLIDLAKHVGTEKALSLSPSDLRDEGIRRAKTYLKKVALIPFPDTGTNWQDLLTLNLIRNLIVHESGHFPENHPELRQIGSFIQKWDPDIKLDDYRKFVLSKKFVERMLSTCNCFLTELFNVLAPCPPKT